MNAPSLPLSQRKTTYTYALRPSYMFYLSPFLPQRTTWDWFTGLALLLYKRFIESWYDDR